MPRSSQIQVATFAHSFRNLLLPILRICFVSLCAVCVCHLCVSMPQHTENWVATFWGENITPKYQLM